MVHKTSLWPIPLFHAGRPKYSGEFDLGYCGKDHFEALDRDKKFKFW